MVGTTEQNILVALAATGPRTTAADIYRHMESAYDDNELPSFGAFYTALVRMHKKKWVKADEDIDERGNDRKYYQISAAGRRAVTQSVRTTWRLGAQALLGGA